MSGEPRGLILTHGVLGAELIKTAALIVDETADLEALSNRGLDAVGIAAAVRAVHARAPERPLVILADLLGGSCAQGCAGLLAEPGVRLLTGVNLPMVIAFLQLRRQPLALDDLVAAILMRARRGIASFPPAAAAEAPA